MQLLWVVNDAGQSVLCVEPAAKLLTLKAGVDCWFAECLGKEKKLPAVSLDTAKTLAEMWLCDISCDLIIELRRRNASQS